MSRLSGPALGLLLSAAPSLAQDAPFHQLVDESIGYVGIGPGIVLLEDDVSSSICKVDVSDVFFFGYANDDAAAMAAEPPVIVCVPTPDLAADAVSSTPGDVAFDQLVDASIGYVSVGPGLLLLEDDVSSMLCRVQVDDAYFLAYATGNADRTGALAPTIICVPSPDLTR